MKRRRFWRRFVRFLTLLRGITNSLIGLNSENHGWLGSYSFYSFFGGCLYVIHGYSKKFCGDTHQMPTRSYPLFFLRIYLDFARSRSTPWGWLRRIPRYSWKLYLQYRNLWRSS